MEWTVVICIMAAYLLGGVCTGYWLVRLRTGLDIREQGSGGVGARNVGRLLGRFGFVATALGDLFKGALAVAVARRLGLSDLEVLLVGAAVVVGHIWPIALGFRGGRGISTVVGAWGIYAPWLLGVLLVSTLLIMVFRRGVTLSGLAAFLVLPAVAHYGFDLPGAEVTVLAAVSAVVLFAHRERIRRAFDEAPARQKA